MQPVKRYVEEHDSLLEGWAPNGIVEDEDGERPASYDTLAEAIESVVEFINDIDEEIASGDRGPDEGFDPAEFRVRDNQTGELYFFEYGQFDQNLLVTGPDNYPKSYKEYL